MVRAIGGGGRRWRLCWLLAAIGWLLVEPTLAAPQRWISLSPHITELVFAAGAGDWLVGVAEHSDYPPAARAIPRVGGHGGLDYERILALRPDLVLAWPSGTGSRVMERLRALGLKLETSEPHSLSAIADDLERIGQLGPDPAIARQRAEQLRQRIIRLQRRHHLLRPVRVFYQIWDRPLMSINGEHILNQAIELCGGLNPFAELTTLTPHLSREAVLLSQPELVLLPVAEELAQRWQADWQRLPASADWQFAQLAPDLLQRPTPRMLDGVEQLCRALERVR
ncbi:MAG: cobalamin-binding protein [Gammaproteobacteria bacterium SHHR-1]|uniref:cobalamin-binding protein n=1 Tax=Magnetovirga frankeli TaxID=947516 RepID=UPI0012930B9F|nr:cobalamin-binding protein [gamma proteobacterium SS-5]